MFYSLGFPLLCALITAASRRAAARDAAAAETAAEGEPSAAAGAAPVEPSEAAGRPEASVVSRRRHGRAALLLRSYRPEFWYWESFEVLRKYALTSVVLVVAHDTVLQIYLGLLVCVAAALLVARHQPYKDRWCGRVQMLALTQLAFTYMSGMLFFDDGGARPWGESLDEDAMNQWGVALVIVNLLVFGLLGASLTLAVGGAARVTR